jgi:hypothetical protein
MFENLFKYRGSRYLWVSLLLVALSVGLYASHSASNPPSGSSWQGYTLGTVGALLIVWLAWLGIRKRSYGSSLGTVQGWTSAHIYLGTAVLIIASLHSALEFGWNVHTVAYVLMCLVIFSGFYGLHVYINYPHSLSDNRRGGSRQSLFAELYELNTRGLALVDSCSADLQRLISSSIERTAIGGGVLAQLSGRDGSLVTSEAGKPIPNKDQQYVIDLVAQRIPKAEKAQEVVALEEMLSLLCRRQTILRRIRKDVQLEGWLRIWLYVHVPLTLALIVALIVHIITTFIYW